MIVYATGFHLSEFPFIEPKHLNVVGKHRNCTCGVPPVYDDLFVIGHFQTSTGYWPLMDYQSQITSSAFLLAARAGAPKRPCSGPKNRQCPPPQASWWIVVLLFCAARP